MAKAKVDATEAAVAEVPEAEAQPAEAPQSLESTLTERTEAADVEAPEPASPPAEPATEAEWEGVRDYAKKLGVDLPYRDDAAALSGLLDAYRNAQRKDYYAELGQQLAPHRESIEKYLAEQAKPAPPAPEPWEPPPFQRAWAAMVERDPDTGAIRSKPGYDPAIADKVAKYVDWHERFMAAPHEVMAPFVESRAKELIRQEMQAQRQQTAADAIVAQNASWLFQHHEDGRPVVAADGTRQLTPEGVLYAQTVRALAQGGLSDVDLTAAIARTVVEHAAFRRAQPTDGAAKAGAAAAVNEGPPRAAERPASGGGAARGGGGAAKGSSRGLGLREMLERKLREFPERE